MKPRIIDLFCGAGGAGMGYHRAGFDVVGVDLAPQPNYPFTFIQQDALTMLRDAWYGSFDAIHASPPCQANIRGLRAVNQALGRTDQHVDLIPATRELLRATGLPYVIENVVGAELIDPVRLCGSSFGLEVRRHRLFESDFPLIVPPCAHGEQNGDHWTSHRPRGEMRRSRVVQVYGNGAESHKWGPAMDIDWMTWQELAEAIPPAYTELIGHQLITNIVRPRV